MGKNKFLLDKFKTSMYVKEETGYVVPKKLIHKMLFFFGHIPKMRLYIAHRRQILGYFQSFELLQIFNMDLISHYIKNIFVPHHICFRVTLTTYSSIKFRSGDICSKDWLYSNLELMEMMLIVVIVNVFLSLS